MAHYTLAEGVFLVKGALRGALLDTNTENAYSVNAASVAVITGEVRNDSFWEELISLELAERRDQSSKLPDLPRLQKRQLDFIWFELESKDCNESCIHCYVDSMPPSHRRTKGLPALDLQNPVRKLTFEEWCALIEVGYELGCHSCQFIGGEPFLYRDGDRTVLELAEYAKDVGYTWIEIFTNATLLTRKKVLRVKELGVSIAVSLYSNNPEVHDSITQTSGSHARTVASLRLLKEAGVQTRVEIVAMKQNENTIPATIRLVNDLGFQGSRPDPLRPRGLCARWQGCDV